MSAPLVSWLHPAVALLLAPLLLSVIHRTKALFAGRRGPSFWQPYRDLAKLLRKGAVYSRTTTWVFRAGPMIGLAAVVTALPMTPFAGNRALLSFPGDLVLFACLFGLMRFVTILAALDTGSAFEGMGASREAAFSALAEPALFLGLAALARRCGSPSLSDSYAAVVLFDFGPGGGLPLLLVGASFFIVFLWENARIPFDDPNTHLELTMVHEVMILDHSGPDLAFAEYGAALKLWILGTVVTGILLPMRHGHWAVDFLFGLGGLLVLAVATGVVESTAARLRLTRIPQALVAAAVLSGLGLMLTLR